MVKSYIILFGLLFFIAPSQIIQSETITKEDLYVTTEDIIADIVLPTIDKKIEKEYGRNLDWDWLKVDEIQYNSNHSYDVTIKLRVSLQGNQPFDYVDAEIRLRISPSCDSEKINPNNCNHGFKIEVLDYKQISP